MINSELNLVCILNKIFNQLHCWSITVKDICETNKSATERPMSIFQVNNLIKLSKLLFLP